MRRVVEPELLDQLPPQDPLAIRSRRDLRVINWFMGNIPLIGRMLGERLATPPRTMVDLGAGDGTATLALAKALGWKGVRIQLLDMKPVVTTETVRSFRDLDWEAEVLPIDLHDWIRQSPRCDLLLANLFLHHSTDDQLRGIFAAFAGIADAVISCDPRRWRPAMVTTRLLWFIGCNSVTRHDARASVRAGFRGKELSALWPRDAPFDLAEVPGGYASHLFMAVRRGHSGAREQAFPQTFPANRA